MLSVAMVKAVEDISIIELNFGIVSRAPHTELLVFVFIKSSIRKVGKERISTLGWPGFRPSYELSSD